MKSKNKAIKLLTLLFTLSILCHAVQADTVMKNGVFQAYWKAEWNDDATINTPQLGFRYFPVEPSLKKIKVIDILMDGSEGDKIIFIKNHFHRIPANFLKYKEWYVNQKGDLTVKQIKHYIECDTDNYIADFVSFTPAPPKTNEKTDDNTGCVYGGSFPYLTSYILKSDKKSGQMKAEPNDNAKTNYTFTRNESIVKIKTINKEWMYASVRDPTKADLLSDRRGYIKFSDVEPLN